MPQPPYLPDLAPCDFFLFPRLKRLMKGRRFATIEEIKTESLRELKDIAQTAYQKGFEDWKKHIVCIIIVPKSYSQIAEKNNDPSNIQVINPSIPFK